MRYKIIFLIFTLAQITTVHSDTRLVLLSNNRSSSPIPYIKNHPYSCELIAFELSDKNLSVKISNIDSSVKSLKLLVEGVMCNETIKI